MRGERVPVDILFSIFMWKFWSSSSSSELRSQFFFGFLFWVPGFGFPGLKYLFVDLIIYFSGRVDKKNKISDVRKKVSWVLVCTD